jgi:hypothetical protein
VFPGKDHEHQRKIMAPAFFTSQLKAFVPTFQDVASKVLLLILGLICDLNVTDAFFGVYLSACSKVER